MKGGSIVEANLLKESNDDMLCDEYSTSADERIVDQIVMSLFSRVEKVRAMCWGASRSCRGARTEAIMFQAVFRMYVF